MSPPPIRKSTTGPAGVRKPPMVRPPQQQKDKLLGTTLGKVTLVRKIGRGGMGDVYLGEHTMLQRSVAVKVLPQDFTRNAELLSRFRREAVACAKLEHPNIVQVYDVGSEGEIWYIIMTYVDGQSFQDMLDEANGPIDVREATRIVCDCTRGLQIAHESGIIHRDVKPANVLLSKKGEVRITDFGLAYDQESQSLITMPGTMMGTPHFMSPEQAQGRRADERSDIYSIGIMLYYALTGQRPFLGESHMAIMYKHINEQPTPIRKLNAQVPEYLAKVVVKCLQKQPQSRYKTCTDLVRDLEAYLNGNWKKEPAASHAPLQRAAGRVPVGKVLAGKAQSSHEVAAVGTGKPKTPASQKNVFIAAMIAILAVIGLLVVAMMKTKKGEADESSDTPPATTSAPPPPATSAARTTAQPPPLPALTQEQVKRYNVLVEEGDFLLGAKQYDKAESKFKAALEIDPKGGKAKKGMEDVASARKTSSVDPPSTTDIPPPASTSQTPPANASDAPPSREMEPGFEKLPKMVPCCGDLTVHAQGVILDVEGKDEPHGVFSKLKTYAELAVKMDIRLLQGSDIRAVVRSLEPPDSQRWKQPDKEMAVQIAEVLRRGEWAVLELDVAADSVTCRLNGQKQTESLVGCNAFGRVGIVFMPGVRVQLTNIRIKVGRIADPDKSVPVSNGSAASGTETERLAKLVGEAERRAIRDERAYASVLAAAAALATDADSGDIKRQAGALAKLLEGATGVMAAFREGLSTVKGQTAVRYRDGREERITVRSVEERVIKATLASGGEGEIALGTLSPDFVLESARRKRTLTDLEIAALLLCDGNMKGLLTRLFPDGKLKKEAIPILSDLLADLDTAATFKFLGDSDVKMFVDRVSASIDSLPKDQREHVKSLLEEASPKPAADLRADVERLIREKKSKEAQARLATMLKRYGDDPETRAAAEAAYPLLSTDGWQNAWNGKDFTEFIELDTSRVSISGGVIKVKSANDGMNLHLKAIPESSGFSAEINFKEWASGKGSGLIYSWKDSQNHRFWICHKMRMSLQTKEGGTFLKDKRNSEYPAGPPLDRWSTMTILNVGASSLYFFDGKLVARGAATEATIAKDAGMNVTECVVDFRNLRVRPVVK